jgi:hypothetical protein
MLGLHFDAGSTIDGDNSIKDKTGAVRTACLLAVVVLLGSSITFTKTAQSKSADKE